ncbi:MAG TPA: hypothetical protein VGH54_10310 [Mycobacterium sp.]|jgi:hypothetical protein|uniref:hypothetical protein n=1 Tax=Mycobacterium sp. TaxID=1785 RepID=UPI002F3F490C
MDVLPTLHDPGLELAMRLHSRAVDLDELHEHREARELRAKAVHLLDTIDRQDVAEETTAEDLTSSIRPAAKSFDFAEFQATEAARRRRLAWKVLGCAALFTVGFWLAVGLLVSVYS